MRFLPGTTLLLLCVALPVPAPAQAVEQSNLQFEVASVRVAPPLTSERSAMITATVNFGLLPAPTTGQAAAPGASPRDPNRISLPSVPMQLLLNMAFDVPGYRMQISDSARGAAESYDVTAATPPGTTKTQAQQMLRNLLVERFGMKFHYETREADVYELTVDKNGHKLKESSGAEPPSLPPGFRMQLGPDGFPQLPPGRTAEIMVRGHARLQAVNMPISELATRLGAITKSEIIDRTSLTAKYDFTLDYDPGFALPAGATLPTQNEIFPPLEGAIRSLGLRMEKKKGEARFVVIDALNKAPTEN